MISSGRRVCAKEARLIGVEGNCELVQCRRQARLLDGSGVKLVEKAAGLAFTIKCARRSVGRWSARRRPFASSDCSVAQVAHVTRNPTLLCLNSGEFAVSGAAMSSGKLQFSFLDRSNFSKAKIPSSFEENGEPVCVPDFDCGCDPVSKPSWRRFVRARHNGVIDAPLSRFFCCDDREFTFY